MAVIGYARVSTDKQDVDRQRLDIYDFAKANKLEVARFVDEIVSSKKKNRQIFELTKSLHKDDVIIVTELSRLARSMIELNDIVSDVVKAEATIRAVSGGYEVDGSITSQAIVFAMGAAAQIERDMIGERTKSALAARKAQGMILGRPIGSATKVEIAIQAKGYSKDAIQQFLSAGVTVTALGKMLNVDARTVKKWLVQNDMQKKPSK